jgi:hypothetical protein
MGEKMEYLNKLGKNAYKALSECVQTAIDEENSEIAVICGLPLVKLASAEGANYFGYENHYNYNTAVGLAKNVTKLADKLGVPRWLRDDITDIKKTLKELE